jgi:hypothetical protein
MTIFERLSAYFTKNGGLNTVTGTIIPVIVQVTAVVSPDLSQTIVAAFTPEVSAMLLQGGAGAVAAGVIVLARVILAVKRK